MRRVGFSALIFLPEIKVKPYVGFGYSFNFIKQAVPEGQFFATPEARDTVMSRVDAARAQGNLFGKIGVMYLWRRFAPFAEYSVMPTKGSGDWYLNGNGMTNIWSLGLRYNFGTSIDKRLALMANRAKRARPRRPRPLYALRGSGGFPPRRDAGARLHEPAQWPVRGLHDPDAWRDGDISIGDRIAAEDPQW